jgi:single-stranded-DNA-specific exonuclease
MDKYERFRQRLQQAAEEFREVKGTVRVVSHLDSDGICACSILISALNNENLNYSVSIVPQLDAKILNELAQENYDCFVFTDLGSGQLKNIAKYLKGRRVFVLDHHQPEAEAAGDIVHVNPHLLGIDGSKEIAGAGVTYLFATALNEKNRGMAHIAIIGAIGDLQEEKGFRKLNDEILSAAKEQGMLEISNGLRAFGSQTRPIHKLLEYSTNPYIPGVTGSESAAIQFLRQLGINPKLGKGWKKLVHLSDEEKKKLATAIILKREGEHDPEDIFGFTYLLCNEAEESPLKDAKEFSTLLNACGRMNKASLGIGACIGNEKSKQKAIRQLNRYRREIISAVQWYQGNKDKKSINQSDGYVIINARDEVPSTMIGTLASILSRSNEFEKPTLVLSMAYTNDDTIKVSLRASGRPDERLDLRKIVQQIVARTGGEAGGHMGAAGALVPIEQEELLIKAAKESLSSVYMEERVR